MSHNRRLKGWRDLISEAPARSRVLVVEDDQDVRRSLQRLVASFGHEINAAADAEEADNWLKTERFEVMLLDIELPGMNGVEFLSWALDRDAQLAVLMVTGINDPKLAIECLDGGARTYLVKPVDSEFLRLALRDALAMRQLLMERNESREP